MIPHFKPIHPKDFREKHKLSVAQISIISGIPVQTLKGWFSKGGSKRACNPPIGIEHYFGLLDSLMCGGEHTPMPKSVCAGELTEELELTIKFRERVCSVELSKMPSSAVPFSSKFQLVPQRKNLLNS